MEEEYTENGKKIVKTEYKIAEEIIENPINLKIEKDSENYKAENENSASSENSQKGEIKREGDKMCWCGSGKKFEDCHGKHLRVDKNPGASVKEYEHELSVRSIDEYETPESEKEYEVEEKKEEEPKSDDFLLLKEPEEEEKQEKSSEYKKEEKDEEES